MLFKRRRKRSRGDMARKVRRDGPPDDRPSRYELDVLISKGGLGAAKLVMAIFRRAGFDGYVDEPFLKRQLEDAIRESMV